MSGTLVVDYDPDVWVEPDLEADPEQWALDTARQCVADAGLGDDAAVVTPLSAALLHLVEYAHEVPGMTFFHVPHPQRGVTGLATLTVTEAGDGSEQSLRSLVGAEDPELIEPPTVDPVDTPLGRALRARRYRRAGDDGTVLGALTYAWHVPMVDADLRLTTGALDLADLTAMEEHFDALAQAVTIELPLD